MSDCSSAEVGSYLGKSLLLALDPLSEDEEEPPNRSFGVNIDAVIPIFQKPQKCTTILPGGLRYVKYQLPPSPGSHLMEDDPFDEDREEVVTDIQGNTRYWYVFLIKMAGNILFG